ncbi:hypothetical protein [Enterococcus mundtii]|uniref:Uncharacterized protein n=1 Tax=Enterococcus mundtii TaxID=53346 RepID=A0A1V2ULL8_ENTMU|nr:hypothetical protein [Enterococcus mundtii]ONN44153.1 hypothetical protein BTN92_04775 [Enterococcus mundtii]
MFYKKYEDYLKEYLNKDISIKSVKPHEEKIFNEFQAKAILDSNSETLREEFHFVLDLISSRKEVNEEKTNDLKKSFERMIQGIDPSDYNALRFSIYKSRMMVLKENIRERETSSKEVPPTFTSNTSLQASDELVSPKLVAEQEKRFAEQATLNKRDNGKQEALSNEQIKENVATYVNLAHTTNQSTKEEQHQRPKVSDLKERFEKERSYNKEPHSAEVPSGTVNRLRQYYEGLNHSTNDHSPLESRKSSRWRTSQTNDSPNVQNRQNQPTDRQNQRNEGTSSYQKSPPLKGTSEFVRRGYERTVYTNESSPTNKAEPDQTGMTNEELQRRRDRFGNMPGPSNEPPVIKRTTQSEPDNYQTATYQNPPRQQRSSELVQEGQASRIDNNDSLRTNNAEWSQTGRANEEFQRYRDRFGNMPGPSNEPPVIERTTQSEPYNYQTVAYQNPPRQQRSSELVHEGQTSRIDNNDSLRTNNVELNQTGRADEEFQNLFARFENQTSTSNEPSFSKKKSRGENEHQGTSYQRVTTLHGSSEIVRKGNGSAVHTNDSASANETKSNQNDMTNEEFQNRRTRFENSSVKSDNHLASESTGRVKAVRDQFENPNAFSNERSIPEPTGQVRAARERFEKANVLRDKRPAPESTGRVRAAREWFEKANVLRDERPVPESTGQVRAARDRFEKANEFSNNRPVPESTGRVKAVRDQFENPNAFSNERSIPEPTGRVKAASDRFEKANEFSNDRLAPESTGQVRAARDRFEKANEFSNDRPVPEPTGRVKAARDRFEKANEFSNDRPVPESTGRVRAARERFEKANVLRDERPAPESTGRVKAASDQFEKANDHPNERPAPESTGRVRAARERFEKANVLRDERPVPESTGRVEAMRRQYESRTGRETEASDSNETFQQKQNGLANERFRQRQNQFENPAGTSSDGPKSEETVIADQLDRRKETSNQPTVHSADQTDITDIAAGNTKKIRELLADKLKFNPEEKVPSETNTQTNTQTDSSHASVEESSSDTQNSQMRNQMSEGGEPKPTKLDEASIATRGMDKKQSENITDPLDKLGIDASSSTLGLNENASEKTDKTTETDFMDDDIELPESGPHTQKKKIHTKKSRAIQIGRILLNLLPLASWPLISMWVTGILGIVPIYFAMYGLPLTLFIYGTVLAAFYGPKLINYIRKLRSRIQNYRQAERNRQRNLKDRVIDPKEKSIQRETAAHEKETAKTKKQDHASEKVGFENPEKDKSVKGYFKRNWKSFAIIIGVGLAVAGIGIALTPVVAPYIFAAATSTPLFMYKATSVIAMALAVSFGVTALSKGLHALQRKFYKKENQTLETTTQKETIEKNSLEVDKDFDKVYEKVDKDDRAPAHDNSSIESAGSKEDGIKLASNETKSMEKSPYAWVYGQETENKTQNESNRSSRTNSFNTHETLHVKEDIHEPPSQSLRENRATNQLGEAARYQVDNRKSESNPQIAEQNKGINRQPVVKEAFDSIKQKAISKSNNVSGKPLMKGQISFEK